MRITKQLLPKRLRTELDRQVGRSQHCPLHCLVKGKGGGRRVKKEQRSFFVLFVEMLLNKLPTESALPELGCKRIMRTCRRASGLVFDVAYVNNGMGT